MSYYVLQPILAGGLVVLGVLGGALALRAFSSGRVRDGLRRTGWALIPFGLLAVGVAGLAARLVGAFTRWAFQLAFSPVSWIGVGILAVGVVLVLAARPRGGAAEQSQVTGRAGRGDPYAPREAEPAAAPRSVGRGRASQRDAGASGLLAELDDMGLLDDDERR
ncbi:hypothetical protein KLP28_07555 [Nocardioidaceae bacterium]|nr:hypothetical protein KLP28_07555 [Nocardioidaceae bacterium]